VTRVEDAAMWLDDGTGAARVFLPAALGLPLPPAMAGQVWRVTGVVVENTPADAVVPRFRLQPRGASDLEQQAGAGWMPYVPAPLTPTPLVPTPEPTETAVP
jgi:hypothetical protein